MRVRVYQAKDGVRVFMPAEGKQLEEVADKDPTLKGLPFVDVEDSALPDRAERARWTIQKGQVVVGQREG